MFARISPEISSKIFPTIPSIITSIFFFQSFSVFSLENLKWLKKIDILPEIYPKIHYALQTTISHWQILTFGQNLPESWYWFLKRIDEPWEEVLRIITRFPPEFWYGFSQNCVWNSSMTPRKILSERDQLASQRSHRLLRLIPTEEFSQHSEIPEGIIPESGERLPQNTEKESTLEQYSAGCRFAERHLTDCHLAPNVMWTNSDQKQSYRVQENATLLL